MNKEFILFDNDGVLVETENWYYQASKKALKEFFDYDMGFEEYMGIMTRGGGVWSILDDASQEQIIKARDKRNEYYQHYLQNEDIVIGGVQDVLARLSEKYNMAIITTARRVDFELIHKDRGIVDFMDFVLCEGEYPRAKPHPDPYLKGLERFGAKPSQTVVVEDSQRGLTAAHDAGIECITVHNDFTKTQDFSKATRKIQSFHNLLDLL
ncbi:MAG: HAD family hydrolase [Campylobacterota bacterium]